MCIIRKHHVHPLHPKLLQSQMFWRWTQTFNFNQMKRQKTVFVKTSLRFFFSHDWNDLLTWYKTENMFNLYLKESWIRRSLRHSNIDDFVRIWGPREGSVFRPSVDTFETGPRWSPMVLYLPCPEVALGLLPEAGISVYYGKPFLSFPVPSSSKHHKCYVQQISLRGTLSSTCFWILFYIKQTLFVFVTCFRLNFDNIYRRLTLVPVNEPHLYLAWLQTWFGVYWRIW